MKKTILLFFVLFAMGMMYSYGSSLEIKKSSSDVESTFVAGDKVFNFGLGLGNTYRVYGWDRMRVPPVSISGEFGVIDDFIVEDLTLGIGAYFGFSSSTYYTNIFVAGRAAVHYPLIENLDTYTGLMLGIRPSITSASYYNNHYYLLSSWFAGGRYYLNDNFAIFGELGWGVAYLTIGAAIKF